MTQPAPNSLTLKYQLLIASGPVGWPGSGSASHNGCGTSGRCRDANLPPVQRSGSHAIPMGHRAWLFLHMDLSAVFLGFPSTGLDSWRSFTEGEGGSCGFLQAQLRKSQCHFCILSGKVRHRVRHVVWDLLMAAIVYSHDYCTARAVTEPRRDTLSPARDIWPVRHYRGDKVFGLREAPLQTNRLFSDGLSSPSATPHPQLPYPKILQHIPKVNGIPDVKKRTNTCHLWSTHREPGTFTTCVSETPQQFSDIV